MKKLSYFLILVFAFNFLTVVKNTAAANLGSFIKRQNSSAIYYLGQDGKRHPFPSADIFLTWQADFSNVVAVSDAEALGYPLGANVPVRPGTKLIQAVTNDTPWVVADPKVYAVSNGQTLRHISSASVAVELYGANWETMIVPVVETVFTNYQIGERIDSKADFDLTNVTNVASSVEAELTYTPDQTPEPALEPEPEPGPVVTPDNWPQFELASGLSQAMQPTVITLDDSFGVSWLGQNSSTNQYDIYYSAFNIAGTQTVNPTLIATSSDTINEVTMDRGSDDLVLAWVTDDGAGHGTIMTARIDAAGSIVSGPTVALDGQFDVVPNSLSVQYNGKNYGLLWSALKTDEPYSQIYFLLLNSSAEPIRAVYQVSDRSEDNIEPDMTWNGSSFGVAWRSANEIESNIFFIPLDDFGEKTLSYNETQINNGNFLHPSQPSITGHYNEFVISWYDFITISGGQRQQILLERVGENLVTYLDDFELTDYDQSFDGFEPQVFLADAKNNIVWRRDDTDIFFSSYADDLTYSRFREKIATGNGIHDLSVSNLGETYAVAWTGKEGNNNQVYYTLGK